MTKTIKISLIVSLLTNLIFLSILFINQNRNKEAIGVYYSSIQREMINLDAIIAYQLTTNWESENLLMLKLHEVKNNIGIAINLNNELKVQNSRQQTLLLNLYNYFDKLDTDTYPGLSKTKYTEEEKNKLINLHKKLMQADLSIEQNSYSNTWDSFEQKINIIIKN